MKIILNLILFLTTVISNSGLTYADLPSENQLPLIEFLTPKMSLECALLHEDAGEFEPLSIQITDKKFAVVTDSAINLKEELCDLNHHEKYTNVIHCLNASLPNGEVYYLIQMPQGRIYNPRIGFTAQINCYRVKTPII